MYVSAPRPIGNGLLNTTRNVTMNIAPSGTGHATAGYTSPGEAINNSYLTNTEYSTNVARGERALMQSGIIGYKEYRNTPYRSSYMRRQVLQRGIHLARHVTSKRYYAEAVPIRLGATDVTYSGWLDNTREQITPWGTELSVQGVYNAAVLANTRNRGVVECKQKMLESKMDLAESLVDINKTVLLICERTMQVLLAWQYARKGQYQKALKTLGITKANLNFKSASEFWLEVQYAWLPLLSDVFSGVEVVKDLFNDPLAHHTYAKRRVKGDLWVRDLSGDANEWKGQTNQKNAYCEVETKYRFRIQDAVLAYITGFQLSNPLYVFWVSMPFTFVVDWFMPLGDWLGSLTATHGLQFVDGYQTTKTFASITVSGVKRITWRSIWTEQGGVQPARSNVTVVCMERVNFTSWPMSYTYFKFPFTSPQRIASAIALTRVTSGKI
jgi:hypothetical protein